MAQQIDEVYWKVHGDPTRNPPLQPTHRDDNERLWTEFVADFTDAFRDTAEAERAYGDLQKLELRGNRVDDYIVTFEKLLRRAGWDRDAHGSVEMFKGRLPRKLVYMILQRDQVPHTINEWQRALRNEIQRCEMIDATLGTRTKSHPFSRNKFPSKTKEGPRRWQRDPNVMDVDAAIMGADTKKGDGRLSEGEKKKRQVEGRCFTCGRQGHMSHACPKKRDGEKAKSAHKAEIKNQQEEERGDRDDAANAPPPYNSEGMMAQIRAMNTEERDKFLDQLMMTEEGF